MKDTVRDAPSLDDLVTLARACGDVVREGFSAAGVARTFKDEESGNPTPVTAIDTAVNALVIERLRARFPKSALSIRGEEQSDLSNAPFELVCDPIDGTFPFAAGIPVSTTMLALLHDGRPVHAVIYDPILDQLYSASRGQGAFRNGAPIRVTDADALSSKTVIGTCWWSTSPDNIGQLAAVLPALYGASVMNLLSVGYMGAKVAAGEFAANVFPGSNAHDSAAIDLLVGEAGGVVTDLRGQQIDYRKPVRGHLAAGPRMHALLLDIVRRLNP